MNLKGWREEKVSEKLLGYYAGKGGNLFACDQDTINGALRGRIMTLPPRYNFFTNYRYFRYETLAGLNASYEAVGKQEFEMARRHPVVIHYAGDERPWIAGNRNPVSYTHLDVYKRQQLDLESQNISSEVYQSVSQAELAAFEVQMAERELAKGQQEYLEAREEHDAELARLKEDYDKKSMMTQDELWEQQNQQYESARRALAQSRRCLLYTSRCV